ncbi:MAG: hypothetical protein HQK59_14560 [Deltaproteobacteria bacterium]|nr:hypothetical protein [Deltaproteobacteria bacterium]
MEQLLDILLVRLCNKGLVPIDVPRVIIDVMHIIGDGGSFTTNLVNQQLARLGWQGQVVDDVTFELIVILLENQGTHRVARHSLH